MKTIAGNLTFTLVFLSIVPGPVPVCAGLLGIDFGKFGSALQPGWWAFEGEDGIDNPSSPSIRSFTNQFGLDGEIEVSVWASSTASGQTAIVPHGFRERDSLGVHHPAYGINNLVRTEVKANSPATPNTASETLHLGLANLSAGRYELTTYHHQISWKSPGEIAIIVDDADATSNVVTASFAQSQSGPGFDSPAHIASHTLRFRSDGVNPVAVRFQELGGDDPEAVLNGFTLGYLPTILRVDFGTLGGTSGVQSGWEGFEVGSGSSANVTGTSTRHFGNQFGLDGEVGVSVWATSTSPGTPAHGFRARTPIAGGPFVDLKELLGDKVKANSLQPPAPDETLYLELDNLSAGSYDLITYHHQSHTNDPGWIDIFLDDAKGTDQLVTADFRQSWGSNPEAVASHALRFHADGLNPVVIRFQEIAVTGSGDREAVLNGFILIPEPSSLLLLGFGFLCFLVGPRRSCRASRSMH